MKMYNPPHPGEILNGLWLQPAKISITEAANALAISQKTLSKIINGQEDLSAEMAVRLSIALGTSAESWMGHQVSYDLWQIEQHKSALGVQVLNVA